MRRLGKLCGPCGPCGGGNGAPKGTRTATDHADVTLGMRPVPAPSASSGRTSSRAKAPPAAPAVDLPDFSGKWQLSDSRNFDEYLSAMGVNYLKRKMAAGMKPVQEWALVDGTWQFSVNTPIGLKVEKFPIGGYVPDEVDGEAMVKHTTWDGAVLNTAVVPKDPKKSAALGKMSMRRYLVGSGEAAKLVLEMKVGSVVAFREFSRVGPAPTKAAGATAAVSAAPAAVLPSAKPAHGSKAAPAAPAVDLPDFSGKWQLSDSRNFDEYLSAMGVNYVKRKVAAGMKPVQEWALVGGTWQFSVNTPIGLKVEKFPIGEEVRDEVDGEVMGKLTSWQGAVLHTAVVPKDAAKAAKFGEMSMRRYLVGSGEAAKLVLEMKVGSVVAFREFSRAK